MREGHVGLRAAGKVEEADAVVAEEVYGAASPKLDMAVKVVEIGGIERGRNDAGKAAVGRGDATRDADRQLAVEPGDERRADIGASQVPVALGAKMRPVADIGEPPRR